MKLNKTTYLYEIKIILICSLRSLRDQHKLVIMLALYDYQKVMKLYEQMWNEKCMTLYP